MTQDTQELAQVIAQAVAIALVEAGLAPAPTAAKPATASTRKEARAKDAKSRKHKAVVKNESAPVVAAKGVSYKLVDKAANMRKQCVMPCRKLRKGKSRFCKAHAAENFQSVRDGNGSIDD